MVKQTTIKNPVSFSGIGLHSGVKVTINLKPAKENTGVIFKRIDTKGENEIPAIYSSVVDTNLGTTIANKSGAVVQTIEHFMAGLWACNVDNVIVEIDNREIPILDGSAKIFIEEISKAGIEELSEERKILKIIKEVEYRDNDKFIILEPLNGFCVENTVDFPYGGIGKQTCKFDGSINAFKEKISMARTFCHQKEIDYMRSKGLALGGSLDNAMVFSDTGLVNEDGFRCGDEVVTHKTLDLIGDLLTSGYYMECKVKAYKAGHGMNNEILKAVFANKEKYTIK